MAYSRNTRLADMAEDENVAAIMGFGGFGGAAK